MFAGVLAAVLLADDVEVAADVGVDAVGADGCAFEVGVSAAAEADVVGGRYLGVELAGVGAVGAA